MGKERSGGSLLRMVWRIGGVEKVNGALTRKKMTGFVRAYGQPDEVTEIKKGSSLQSDGGWIRCQGGGGRENRHGRS